MNQISIFRILRPASLPALVVAALTLAGGDAAADTYAGQQVNPLLRPALQAVQTVCSVQAPDGPMADTAARSCFASWGNVKNLAANVPSLYELASGWEGLASTPGPYDRRLLHASAADAKFVLAQIR
jgi:hypothetical protein